jgi:branched-chain amino acid transport system substrate-binding protein
MFSTDEERDFQKDLQKIKPGKRDPLKGKELSTILKMVFYDGFGQKEATDLRIGDVFHGGNIVSQITPTPQKGSINLSAEVKRALLDYLNDLQPRLTPLIAPRLPLFPNYDGDTGRKRFQRDSKSLNIAFNSLRRDGIHHYCQMLRGNGLTHEQAVKNTAIHFRMEERSIRKIIKGAGWVKSQQYMDATYWKEPIMGPFFRVEVLGPYISDEAGKMIDGFFEAVEAEKETYPGLNVAMKDILLNNMITAIFGNEIPERLKNVLNLPDEKENGSTASQSLAVIPSQNLQPKKEDLANLIRRTEQDFLKKLQGADERARKWKEKKEKLSALFKDPEANHTPEEKVAFKKEKLLDIIEKVHATFSAEETANFLKTKRELEESWMEARKKSREKTQEKTLEEIFVEEKKRAEQLIIRVGVICPESAQERPYVMKAIGLAQDQINNAGGINGYPLAMIINYDGSSDLGALDALKKCARKKVVAVIGPTRSSQILKISDAVIRYCLPMAIGGTNMTLNRRCNPWFFRCRPADSYVADAMVKYIQGDMKLTKVGILYDFDTFDSDGAYLVEQGCKNNGLTVVKKERYITGAKDYLAKLQSLKGAGTEVMVVYGTSPEDVAEIQKQYRSFGSPYAYLGSPSSGMKACLDLSGKDAEGLIVIADYVPGRAATQKYAYEYTQRFNEEMDPSAAGYYDALRILELAIRRVGTKPADIITAILSIRGYEGVLGTYDFTPNGDGLHKVSVIRIKNGGHELIK